MRSGQQVLARAGKSLFLIPKKPAPEQIQAQLRAPESIEVLFSPPGGGSPPVSSIYLCPRPATARPTLSSLQNSVMAARVVLYMLVASYRNMTTICD